MFFRLNLPWQWAHSHLQLLIHPWICTPGTHYGWVDRGSVEYEVCLTLLHMASTGNQTPDLLILSPMPYPLGHMVWGPTASAGHVKVSDKFHIPHFLSSPRYNMGTTCTDPTFQSIAASCTGAHLARGR